MKRRLKFNLEQKFNNPICATYMNLRARVREN